MRVNRNYLLPLSAIARATLYKEIELILYLDDKHETVIAAFKKPEHIDNIKAWMLGTIEIGLIKC